MRTSHDQALILDMLDLNGSLPLGSAPTVTDCSASHGPLDWAQIKARLKGRAKSSQPMHSLNALVAYDRVVKRALWRWDDEAQEWTNRTSHAKRGRRPGPLVLHFLPSQAPPLDPALDWRYHESGGRRLCTPLKGRPPHISAKSRKMITSSSPQPTWEVHGLLDLAAAVCGCSCAPCEAARWAGGVPAEIEGNGYKRYGAYRGDHVFAPAAAVSDPWNTWDTCGYTGGYSLPWFKLSKDDQASRRDWAQEAVRRHQEHMEKTSNVSHYFGGAV